VGSAPVLSNADPAKLTLTAWEPRNYINSTSYVQRSASASTIGNVGIPSFRAPSGENSAPRPDSLHTWSQQPSGTISPVEQATMKDQLIQLTIRVGHLEQMFAPFKDKSQFLDQVAAPLGRSDTLADRINEVNANVSLLQSIMVSLQSQLVMSASLMGPSQLPAAFGVSVTPRDSRTNAPSTTAPLTAKGQDNSPPQIRDNPAIDIAISAGMDIVGEHDLEWSDNANNSLSCLSQPNISVPTVTNTVPGSSESQADPPLSVQAMDLETRNGNLQNDILDPNFNYMFQQW
jgi:hypothetical protein